MKACSPLRRVTVVSRRPWLSCTVRRSSTPCAQQRALRDPQTTGTVSPDLPQPCCTRRDTHPVRESHCGDRDALEVRVGPGLVGSQDGAQPSGGDLGVQIWGEREGGGHSLPGGCGSTGGWSREGPSAPAPSTNLGLPWGQEEPGEHLPAARQSHAPLTAVMGSKARHWGSTARAQSWLPLREAEPRPFTHP